MSPIFHPLDALILNSVRTYTAGDCPSIACLELMSVMMHTAGDCILCAGGAEGSEGLLHVSQGLLQAFIDFIVERKIVHLEELALEFGLRVQVGAMCRQCLIRSNQMSDEISLMQSMIKGVAGILMLALLSHGCDIC